METMTDTHWHCEVCGFHTPLRTFAESHSASYHGDAQTCWSHVVLADGLCRRCRP